MLLYKSRYEKQIHPQEMLGFEMIEIITQHILACLFRKKIMERIFCAQTIIFYKKLMF